MRRRGAAYLLILWNRKPLVRRVGALGRLRLEPGYYVYVGSGGPNGLRRVQRHLSASKRCHWHIDYLTTGPGRMRPVDAYLLPGKDECRLADLLAQGLEPIDGVGSSDCRCRSHLFRARDIAELLRAADPAVGRVVQICGGRPRG